MNDVGYLKNHVVMASARSSLNGPIAELVGSFALHLSAKAVAELAKRISAGIANGNYKSRSERNEPSKHIG